MRWVLLLFLLGRVEHENHTMILHSSLCRAACVGALFLGTAPLSVAHAATFTVTTLADSGSGSLREAITRANRASDADTILFAAQVHGTLGLKSPLPDLSSSVSIVGPGREHLNVRRTGQVRYRILAVTPAGTILLSGLTLSNGFSQAVGKHSHEKGDGGAISNQGILQLNDCAFTGNQSEGNGGAIFNDGPQLTLTNCLLTDNKCLQNQPDGGHVPGGGGIHNGRDGAALLLTSCVFSRNESLSEGGAIHNAASATVRILRSSLTQNTARSGGALAGLIDIAGEYAGSFVVTESLLANNKAESGGAISMATYSGRATLTNCTVSGNTATETAGAIRAGWPGVELSNCTITGNTAPKNAGIVASVDSDISQCIIAGNWLPSHAPGTDIQLWKPEEMKQPDPSHGWNLIGGGDATTLAYFQKTGDKCNVSSAALKLGPLSDNGGPTKTHALLSGSLAIGQGFSDPNIPCDQRGVLRYPLRDGQADIGAFQSVPASSAKTKLY